MFFGHGVRKTFSTCYPVSLDLIPVICLGDFRSFDWVFSVILDLSSVVFRQWFYISFQWFFGNFRSLSSGFSVILEVIPVFFR